MNILTGGFNTYSSLDRRIFLLKYSSCKMLPAMYNSAESIVCGGVEAAGEVRPGQNSGGRGAWPLCIVLLGAGWWRLVPASARPRHCPASLLCRQWPGCAPRAPHRPAHYCRGSIVSGDGRQPPVHTTLHTATLASADHTAPPVVTRLTSTQHQTHCEVRSSAAWWRGPALPVFSCRSGGGDRGLKAAVQCHSSTVAAVALC